MNFLEEIVNNINNVKFPITPIEKSSMDLAEKIASSPITNPAKYAYELLQKLVKDFEANLNDDQEIGIKIISLGNIGIYHVQKIDYEPPYILIFHCIDKEGNKATLIQHHSQLNFVLTILPKLDPNKQANRIGFIYS